MQHPAMQGRVLSPAAGAGIVPAAGAGIVPLASPCWCRVPGQGRPLSPSYARLASSSSSSRAVLFAHVPVTADNYSSCWADTSQVTQGAGR